MNAVVPSEAGALDLVDLIDFKWLMAGAGHRVHVERMQGDAGYACDCLALAACAGEPVLRDCARRLALRLGCVAAVAAAVPVVSAARPA